MGSEMCIRDRPSASDQSIIDTIAAAIDESLPVTWITHADDALVYDELHRADVFLSIGIEGYGIPVLEAIRLGTPVIYDGIQPAGEVMEGRGARQLSTGGTDEMAAVFLGADTVQLAAALSPELVPSWREFVQAIAHGCLGR